MIKGGKYIPYISIIQPLIRGVITTLIQRYIIRVRRARASHRLNRTSIDISTSAPELEYAVIFPEQTIEGVTYIETMSKLFNLLSNVTLNMILAPVTEPEPPKLTEIVASFVTGVVLIAVGLSP